MKRCLWVWWDSDGFHQCPSPRKVPHPHSDHPVSRTVHTRMITVPTEPKCLGVWSWTNQVGETWIWECSAMRSMCSTQHPFYVKTRMEEPQR